MSEAKKFELPKDKHWLMLGLKWDPARRAPTLLRNVFLNKEEHDLSIDTVALMAVSLDNYRSSRMVSIHDGSHDEKRNELAYAAGRLEQVIIEDGGTHVHALGLHNNIGTLVAAGRTMYAPRDEAYPYYSDFYERYLNVGHTVLSEQARYAMDLNDMAFIISAMSAVNCVVPFARKRLDTMASIDSNDGWGPLKDDGWLTNIRADADTVEWAWTNPEINESLTHLFDLFKDCVEGRRVPVKLNLL